MLRTCRFDCQVRTHDVLSGRGRCCFDAQRLTGSPLQLRSKTKNGGGSAVAGQRQIWNPPFVTSLAVHAEDSVVAAGLGSGGVYFFRYAGKRHTAPPAVRPPLPETRREALRMQRCCSMCFSGPLQNRSETLGCRLSLKSPRTERL